MNFYIQNSTDSSILFSSSAQLPIYNASKISNIPVENAVPVENDMLVYDGQQWKYTTSPLHGNTGSTGPTGYTGAQGINGIIGPTGPQGQSDNSKTGPKGYTGPIGKQGNQGPLNFSVSSEITGPTGYTGYTGYRGTASQGIKGVTGYTGPAGNSQSSKTGSTGYTGPQGHNSPASKTGSTGYTGYDGTTGPQGGYILELDSSRGPQGPHGAAGPLPTYPLFMEIDIPYQLVTGSMPYVATLGNVTQNTNPYYMIVSNNRIGVPYGIWKVVTNIKWETADTGFKQIEYGIPDQTQSYATSIVEGSSTPSVEQQFIFMANFFQTYGTAFEVRLNSENISETHVSGKVSIYGMTQENPQNPTGTTTTTPGLNEFVIKITNHDTTNPPQQLGIVYQLQSSYEPGPKTFTGYHMAPNTSDPLHPHQIIQNPTGVEAQTLMKFDWNNPSHLPVVPGEPNSRQLVIGGNDIVLDSARVYIIKRLNTSNPMVKLWQTDSNGIVEGVPQVALDNVSGPELMVDFIEFAYNIPQAGTPNWHLFSANQSCVDGISIPLTITTFYKAYDGYRPISDGPVGITTSMTQLIQGFTNEIENSTLSNEDKDLWKTIMKPTNNPARIIAPQKVPESNPTYALWQVYMDDYIKQVTMNLTNKPVTFIPFNTSVFTECTISCKDATGQDSTIYVSYKTPSPVQTKTFTIPSSGINNKSIDILGQAGVWADGTGDEKVVKVYIVTAYARGMIDKQDVKTGGQTILKNVVADNRVWNDWKDRGTNFYQNYKAHMYGKFLHEKSLVSNVQGTTLTHLYALSFDDNFNYNSSLNSSPVGNPPYPSPDTQIERLEIDIWEN